MTSKRTKGMKPARARSEADSDGPNTEAESGGRQDFDFEDFDEVTLNSTLEAIPKGGVWFDDAVAEVTSAIGSSASFEERFDDKWIAALRISRSAELEANRSLRNSSERFQEGWHRQKQANLFLRLAIESSALTAYCTHPKSGLVFQFESRGWVDNHALNRVQYYDINNQPHPKFLYASPEIRIFDGELRRVFFLQDEFQAWLSEFVKASLAVEGSSVDARNSYAAIDAGAPNATKREAVKEAIRALWPPNGKTPAGIHSTNRDRKINDWLKKNERSVVSAATIKRAVMELGQADRD